MTSGRATRVAVAGAGVAGLTAAVFLARGGAAVRVLEKRARPGGRARTLEREGFSFDLGAHAIYREGAAADVYRELGIELGGGTPEPSQLRASAGGDIFPFPSGPGGLLRASELSWRDRLDFARFFVRLMTVDPVDHRGETIGSWIEKSTNRPATRRIVRSLVRLSTYCDRLDQDAEAVLGQLRMAAGEGVLYPDGGWGTVVRRLRDRAVEAGAEISCSVRVDGVRRSEDGWSVRAAGEPALEVDAVVLAPGSPDAALRLLEDPPDSLQRAAEDSRPVTVSCLDVGLRRLPVPSRPAVLAVDRPLYVSDYASVADVAPDGAALLHAVHYGRTEEPELVERELEEFLDRAQPGWRDEVVSRQFLPRMTVHHDRPDPERGGLRGRYGPGVPEADGLYVAGDWVGEAGLLADAAVASGRRAARMVLEREPEPAAAID